MLDKLNRRAFLTGAAAAVAAVALPPDGVLVGPHNGWRYIPVQRSGGVHPPIEYSRYGHRLFLNKTQWTWFEESGMFDMSQFEKVELIGRIPDERQKVGLSVSGSDSKPDYRRTEARIAAHIRSLRGKIGPTFPAERASTTPTQRRLPRRETT